MCLPSKYYYLYLLIYVIPMFNVKCNEMSPLHSSELESTHCTLTIVQRTLRATKKNIPLVPSSSSPTWTRFRCRKWKKRRICSSCSLFIRAPRRRDKQRRKRLLPLLLCIISFVRWPTVEMSCNYSHSYFPPSHFFLSLLWFCFSSFSCKTKNNTHWNRVVPNDGTLKQTPRSMFIISVFFYTQSVRRGSRPLEEKVRRQKRLSLSLTHIFFSGTLYIMPVIYFFSTSPFSFVWLSLNGIFGIVVMGGKKETNEWEKYIFTLSPSH